MKGKSAQKYAIISGLESGETHVTRVAAISSAGIGLYSTLDQNLAKGIIPLSKTAASVPSAPELLVTLHHLRT